MKFDTLQAYEALESTIRDILAGEGSYLQRIESCFMTALVHWEKLKLALGNPAFDSELEEILFFKATKPRFTGLVEYYTQCYQALLFCPDNGPDSKLYFWKMELKRIDRFYGFHADFVRYCEEGDTELDELYFLRAYSDLSNFEQARVYDLDSHTSSSHDWLVAKLVGMRMYRKVVESELQQLEEARPDALKQNPAGTP